MSYIESALQTKCVKYLKSKDIYVLNTRGSSFMTIGTPDLIACIDGRFVAFELKVKDNDLEPAQRINRDIIVASGGLHFVPRTLEEFISIVEDLCV